MLSWSPVAFTSCQYPVLPAFWFMKKPRELCVSTLHKYFGIVKGTETQWHMSKTHRNSICYIWPNTNHVPFHSWINTLAKWCHTLQRVCTICWEIFVDWPLVKNSWKFFLTIAKPCQFLCVWPTTPTPHAIGRCSDDGKQDLCWNNGVWMPYL